MLRAHLKCLRLSHVFNILKIGGGQVIEVLDLAFCLKYYIREIFTQLDMNRNIFVNVNTAFSLANPAA